MIIRSPHLQAKSVAPTAGLAVDDGLGRRLGQCYTGAVHDVLRGLGRKQQVLPATLRPLFPERKLAGPVFTVSGRPDPDLDAHASLLHWTAFLSRAPRGHVVVCQPNDSTLAHMGELSAETLLGRGVLGYIVDGGCRDTDFILKIGFPVYCRYFTPVDVVGRWKAERFNEPIVIGGVEICAGDYVLADRDGVVVIPRDLICNVVTQTEEIMGTENKVRSAILQGIDPQKAYLAYGKFDPDSPLIRIHPADNIAVLRRAVLPGESLAFGGVSLAFSGGLPLGHKIALQPIGGEQKILKYGVPIGSATRGIAAGEHVHLHNMRSDYLATFTLNDGTRYVTAH